MKLIGHGAEAKLFVDYYLGEKCVVKQRERKKYREKSLDERIIKERMRSECSMLSRAKAAGVRAPIIKKIDPANYTIITEFVAGRTLKEELCRASNAETTGLCSEVGVNVARLHANDLIHGDLTTSNIILRNDRLVFLDFGMGMVSGKIEDKAVDLLVLKKTFLATHFGIAEKWMDIEAAYVKEYAQGAGVLRQMGEVEARARYS